jgi:hypothetical protein
MSEFSLVRRAAGVDDLDVGPPVDAGMVVEGADAAVEGPLDGMVDVVPSVPVRVTASSANHNSWFVVAAGTSAARALWYVASMYV